MACDVPVPIVCDNGDHYYEIEPGGRVAICECGIRMEPQLPPPWAAEVAHLVEADAWTGRFDDLADDFGDPDQIEYQAYSDLHDCEIRWTVFGSEVHCSFGMLELKADRDAPLDVVFAGLLGCIEGFERGWSARLKANAAGEVSGG